MHRFPFVQVYLRRRWGRLRYRAPGVVLAAGQGSRRGLAISFDRWAAVAARTYLPRLGGSGVILCVVSVVGRYRHPSVSVSARVLCALMFHHWLLLSRYVRSHAGFVSVAELRGTECLGRWLRFVGVLWRIAGKVCPLQITLLDQVLRMQIKPRDVLFHLPCRAFKCPESSLSASAASGRLKAAIDAFDRQEFAVIGCCNVFCSCRLTHWVGGEVLNESFGPRERADVMLA